MPTGSNRIVPTSSISSGKCTRLQNLALLPFDFQMMIWLIIISLYISHICMSHAFPVTPLIPSDRISKRAFEKMTSSLKNLKTSLSNHLSSGTNGGINVPGKAIVIGGKTYIETAFLGGGHFARVFEAYRSGGNMWLAIKTFKRSDPLFKMHYENEVKALEKLGLLVAKDDANLRIVEKKIPGVSMDHLLSIGYSPNELQLYEKAYSKAIDEFHRKTGFLHNDLRPGNVMFYKGKAQIIDFGTVEELPVGISKESREALFMQDKENGLLNFQSYLEVARVNQLKSARDAALRQPLAPGSQKSIEDWINHMRDLGASEESVNRFRSEFEAKVRRAQ